MKLYMIHVGFYDENIGIYELHSNIFVAAEDIQSAKQRVMKKDIFIEKKMHIDGILEIKNVDGYEVNLSKKESSDENPTYNYAAIKNL